MFHRIRCNFSFSFSLKFLRRPSPPGTSRGPLAANVACSLTPKRDIYLNMSGGTEGVLQRVNQFWSMLDDLSQNDPAAYRRFIQKQMEEGAEFSAPPELHSCLCTELLVRLFGGSGVTFISANVFTLTKRVSTSPQTTSG